MQAILKVSIATTRPARLSVRQICQQLTVKPDTNRARAPHCGGIDLMGGKDRRRDCRHAAVPKLSFINATISGISTIRLRQAYATNTGVVDPRKLAQGRRPKINCWAAFAAFRSGCTAPKVTPAVRKELSSRIKLGAIHLGAICALISDARSIASSLTETFGGSRARYALCMNVSVQRRLKQCLAFRAQCRGRCSGARAWEPPCSGHSHGPSTSTPIPRSISRWSSASSCGRYPRNSHLGSNVLMRVLAE